MTSTAKPLRLFQRFNSAAKSVAIPLALGLAFAGSAYAGAASTETSPSPAPASVQAQAPAPHEFAGGYEYLGDRTIRLTGTINTETAIKVIEKMLELSQQDPDADIELRINSGGGVVDDGFAIYDVMKSLPNDIRTVCEGRAQSMAAFLLSAGTPGKRYAYPNCDIMFHQPSWGVSGMVTEMDIVTDQANNMKDRMMKIIAANSGLTEETIRDLLRRNFYPTTEEAKEMGFIDHVLSDPTPEPPAAPRVKLPDGFCDRPGREHMRVCAP